MIRNEQMTYDLEEVELLVAWGGMENCGTALTGQ